MIIQTCVKRTDKPAPHMPGLLIGVNNPPPALADAAMSTLGLTSRPHHLLLAIPPRTMASTPLESAMTGAAIHATKMLSKELARWLNAPPLVKHGIDLFWLGVNVANLCDRWADDKPDVPTLVIDSASAIVNGLFIGQNLAGFEGGLLGGDLSSKSLGMVFTAAGATAKGEDLTLAFLNETVESTPVGNILGLAAPIVEAALSKDPVWQDIQFRPLPSIETAHD